MNVESSYVAAGSGGAGPRTCDLEPTGRISSAVIHGGKIFLVSPTFSDAVRGSSPGNYIGYRAYEVGGPLGSLTAGAMRIGLGKAHDGCRRTSSDLPAGICRTSPCRSTPGRWAFGQPGNLFPHDMLTSAAWQRRCHDSRPRIHRMSGPLVLGVSPRVRDSATQFVRFLLHRFSGRAWSNRERHFSASLRSTDRRTSCFE